MQETWRQRAVQYLHSQAVYVVNIIITGIASMEAYTTSTDAVLIYDGLCALCNSAVQFVLKYGDADIRFAPLQGVYAKGFLERRPELRTVDSILLVERGADGAEHVTTRSDAVLRVLVLGGWHRAARILGRVPRRMRDAVYDGVARVRYRLFGRKASCPVPPPSVRARFID
jgi:predicted DCC family thiol-disulfide oxidoreductase YuxK